MIRLGALIPMFAIAGFLATQGCERAKAETAYGAPSPYGQEGLRVSGTAIVRAKPDTVTVTLGKDVAAPTIKDAKRNCDALMAAVVSAIKAKGVAAEGIQTREYRLYDNYREKPARHEWHARHMLEIRTDKVEEIADIIEAAVNAGADRVSEIEYSVASIHELRAQARQQAIKVAKEKARQLASLMGVTLGRAVSIIDSSYRSWYPAAQSAMNAQWEVRSGSQSASAERVLSSGQVAVEANEELVFEIK